MNNKTKIEQPQSVNAAEDELLDRIYISNVQNRLRQLNEPTENDCKRWVWELIQNAKDSISIDKTRNVVDIRLIVKDKEVKFLHNGSPFTGKALLGLLYKYSAEKVNNNESTGRFGTGFLTTHTLSKIVTIEGDVFTGKIDSPLNGFSVTMFRDGLDEPELLEGVKKMRDSKVYTSEINDWTTYTYHLKTPKNEEALRLGLKNFISNITQTLLFCKELNSVELDDNGIITKIIRKENHLLENDIYLSEFEINEKTSYTRRFIHKSLKKQNDDLTKRFKTERDVRITAAIEIDNNKNLVENQDSPSHFCVLPLVGSEKHIMPIYLNSPDFEPDSERESLILIGEEMLADKEIISEGGINRLILKESISLYDSLVSYLSENHYHKLFLLAKGLRKIPEIDKNFNKKWFKEEIVEPYRAVLKKYSVVETKIGNQKLFAEDNTPNIIFPKDSTIENQNKIYNLSTDLFSEKLPLVEIANDWAKLVWEECGLFSIENLCEYIAEKGCINNLELPLNQYDWFNRFLTFINETDDKLLKEHAVIPNYNGDFISLVDEKIAEGVDLTEYVIDVLRDLGEDLTPILLNRNITAISLPLKIDTKSITEKINERAEEIFLLNPKNRSFQKNEDIKFEDIEEKIKRLLPLLNTIPTDETIYSKEFIDKQRKIYQFTKRLYPNLPINEILKNDIPEKAWEVSHKWLIEAIVKKVSESTIGEDQFIWLNNFIAFVSEEKEEALLDKYAIIPNQNGVLCKRGSLSRDKNIPDELKSEIAEKFGIKLKSQLLHKEFDSIHIEREKDINTVIKIAENIFEKDIFEEDLDDLDFAIFLIHFLPEETSPLYNSQKSLLDIVRKYYYQRSTPYVPIANTCTTKEFWQEANDELLNYLQFYCEYDKNIEKLKVSLSGSGKEYDDGDSIIFLNDVFDCLKKFDKTICRKIIPNQKGIFCSLDDLFEDDDIPDLLKNILCQIDPENDFRNILADNTLSVHPPHPKEIKDIASEIDNKMKELYRSAENWEDESFKTAIEWLMMEWFPKHKGKESEDLFPYTYAKKDTIEMNVLWSLEDRQRMQEAKKIEPTLLDEFIASNGEVNSLEKEKEKLKTEVAELTAQIKNSVPDEIKEKFSNITSDEINEFLKIKEECPDITADKINELLKMEERLKGWSGTSDYQPANEIEERRNFENGYKGEAFVYNQLIKSGEFKNIIWDHKSESPTDIQITDYEGHTYYIKDNYSKYDLIAETYDENKIYIEVKSTRTTIDQADSIALPISSREWKFVNQINNNERYCLARVFDVEKNPEGHYLSLMGIEISNSHTF